MRTRTSRVLTPLLAAALFAGGATVAAAPAGAAAATATVTVTSNANPSVFGQKATFTAKVTDPSTAQALLTGTFTFTADGTPLGTVAATNGKATLGTAALTAGSHTVAADYTPPAAAAPVAGGSLVQQVTTAATITTVTSTRPVAAYGQSGSIVVRVKPVAPSTGIPTGSVDILIDGGWFWTAPLDATGKATLSLLDIESAFLPGTYSITATYTGDAGYDPSTSAAVSQTFTGITEPPVTTVTLDAKGRPTFSPTSFSLSSYNPVGCNVTIKNTSPVAIALVYGTPGSWKRLPGGVIAAGASGGVGVGLPNFTGYFSAMGASNYVAVHCH